MLQHTRPRQFLQLLTHLSLTLSFSHAELLPNTANNKQVLSKLCILCILSLLLQPSSQPSNPYSTCRPQLAQMSVPPEASPHFQKRSRCLFNVPLTPVLNTTPLYASFSVCLFLQTRESFGSRVVFCATQVPHLVPDTSIFVLN